jgi:hypothetical protein
LTKKAASPQRPLGSSWFPVTILAGDFQSLFGEKPAAVVRMGTTLS